MKRILLFYLFDQKYGGFATYTAHLYKAFQSKGYKPSIVKVGKTTEKKLRPFCAGLYYQNVSLLDASRLAQNIPSIICCAYWRNYADVMSVLMERGAKLVLHDPTEYDEQLLKFIREKKHEPISIRAVNVGNLAEHGIASTYIPHPYVRVSPPRTELKWHAISMSRVDWDKHTEIIAAANKLLKQDKRITIFGQSNRIYVFHKLNKEYAGWDADYKGAFSTDENAAVNMAAGAKYVVDMSAIARDGGGTQYTFLEAWDAGALLVVNRAWLKSDGVVQEGLTALAAGDAGELAKLLMSHDDHMDIVTNGHKVLAHHGPDVIVPQYEQLLEPR